MEPQFTRLEHDYARNLLKMSDIGQNSMKKWPFLPLFCHELQIMGPKKVFYAYVVPEMIW